MSVQYKIKMPNGELIIDRKKPLEKMEGGHEIRTVAPDGSFLRTFGWGDITIIVPDNKVELLKKRIRG